MKQHEIQEIFVSNLKALRRRAGKTQKQLAEDLGVSRNILGAWEESRCMPTIENLFTMSSLFNLSIEDLTAKELSNQ